MSFILLGKLSPEAAAEIVGAKGEITLSSGTKKHMKVMKERWEAMGETCRIVKRVGKKYVEVK